MNNISEQIADWLVDKGIEQVFTVTGGGAMFLNQALGSHPKLNCTFMHHEQSCAMAAEGYARIKGKPAVVMLTTGPGAINALNGVFGAFTDSIPMIVISGQIKRETCLSFQDVPGLRQLGDQEGPTIALAKNLCKFAEIIKVPKDLEWALPQAYSLATTGRQGPVWLDIPLDIQSSTELLTIEGLNNAPLLSLDLSAPISTVIEKLKQAHRPIILGGTGVRLAGAVEEFIGFAECYGIPVATAWNHDLIASDHPLFAGRPGTIGTRSGNFCLQNSDFVLVIGSRLNIRQTSYNWGCFAKNAYVVQVDIDSAEFRKPTVSVDMTIEADAKDFIEQLKKQSSNFIFPSYANWVAWCQKIGQQYAPEKEHVQQDSEKLNPYVVVGRVFKQARPNDIFVSGNASACIIPFQVGSLHKDQRMYSNSGSASMGFDLPAAIGSAIAGIDSQRRVICFAGDGSLQMNIQELQTVKTLGLNLLIIVLNNEGYLSIKQTHANFFNKVIGSNPESGVEFPDFCQVAQAYGVQTLAIKNQTDLLRLDQCLLQDGPLLIDIHVDPQQEFEPRIKSRVDENGKFITPELDDMFPFLPSEVISEVRQSACSVECKYL